MQPREVSTLIRRSRHIDGWLSADAALLFGLLDEVQRQAGIEGGLFEIGAHHGRSTVFLCAMATASEQVGVCDLFENQSLNVSGSGLGDRDVLERNVRTVAGTTHGLRVFPKYSSDLTADEIGSPQRLFHVDGGHLRAEALSDLHLAASVLHPLGAVVVDDPFRVEWPGVTEAALAFLNSCEGFIPIFLGFNKLVLVQEAAQDTYEEPLSDHGLLWRYVDRHIYATKSMPIVGSPCQIAYVPTWRQRPGLHISVARLLSLRGELAAGARQPGRLAGRAIAAGVKVLRT